MLNIDKCYAYKYSSFVSFSIRVTFEKDIHTHSCVWISKWMARSHSFGWLSRGILSFSSMYNDKIPYKLKKKNTTTTQEKKIIKCYLTCYLQNWSNFICIYSCFFISAHTVCLSLITQVFFYILKITLNCGFRFDDHWLFPLIKGFGGGG